MYLTCSLSIIFSFFFNDTATTEIYTLSLHDALPITGRPGSSPSAAFASRPGGAPPKRDRKSTRLNSSHVRISYAVFCLKKKEFVAAEVLTVWIINQLLDDRFVAIVVGVFEIVQPHQHSRLLSFFFFNDTATTEIYTLSLHDALPI